MLHICGIWFLTALLICLCVRPLHQIIRKSAGIPWSHNPVAGRPQNWSQHTSCDSVTWDVGDLTVTIDWKPCQFTLHQWHSYKGLRLYFSETWLKYLQSPAGRETPYRRVLQMFSHLLPVNYRLSQNRNILPYSWITLYVLIRTWGALNQHWECWQRYVKLSSLNDANFKIFLLQ